MLRRWKCAVMTPSCAMPTRGCPDTGKGVRRSSRLNGYCPCVGIQRDHMIHRFHGKKFTCTVSDFVEAMASTKHLQAGPAPNELLYVFQRVRGELFLCAVLKIPRPVGWFAIRRPPQQRRNHPTCQAAEQNLRNVLLFMSALSHVAAKAAAFSKTQTGGPFLPDAISRKQRNVHASNY